MTIDKARLINADEALAKVSLVDIIEAIREEKDLKMAEICDILKIHKQQYSDFLAGRTSLSVKRAAEWARMLGEKESIFVKCALDDLLHRNNLKYTIELTDISHDHDSKIA